MFIGVTAQYYLLSIISLSPMSYVYNDLRLLLQCYSITKRRRSLQNTRQDGGRSFTLITAGLQACSMCKSVLIFPNNVNDVSSIENRSFTRA
jgi:hypothetical protein